MLEITLSAAAFFMSALTLGLSYRVWQLGDRRSRIPVLVFLLEPDRGWILRNVGNGPALNIVVARKASHGDSTWLDPTGVPPIARDGEVVLDWLVPGSGLAALGATYQDFVGADTSRPGRTYTAICEYSLSSVRPGRRLPAWTMEQIEPDWIRRRKARPGVEAG
jgi:hypothetical protein